MKNMKRTLCLMLVLVTIFSMVPAPISAAESVIDENSGWYWPTVDKKITSGFGIIRSDGAYHQGIDIKASVNTDVYAARPGTVYRSGWDKSMGNYICIYHGKNTAGKHIFSTYMHLSQRVVSKGQSVSAGMLIGKSGNTGESSGPHLHFHVFRSTSSSPSSVSPSRPNKDTLLRNYVDVGKITYNGGSTSKPAPSTLQLNVTSYPTRIKVGSAWGMRGSVTSNYPIVEVLGGIYNASGVKVMSSVDRPNARQLNLQFSQVNNALIFNDLPIGNYQLKISATDASGRTVNWEVPFEVYGDASTLNINMTSRPSSIRRGRCFGLRGTISSNYNITEVWGHIINSNGVVVDETVDRPNSKSLNIRYSALNNYLEFNYLPKGRYTLQVTAKDASGRIVALAVQFDII